MSSGPTVEELSSSSDDDSLAYDSAEELSVDPLADFEKVQQEHQSPETQSRDAAVAGEPADFTNPDNVEPPKEEVLVVEELPEEEMKSVRPQVTLILPQSTFKRTLDHPNRRLTLFFGLVRRDWSKLKSTRLKAMTCTRNQNLLKYVNTKQTACTRSYPPC